MLAFFVEFFLIIDLVMSRVYLGFYLRIGPNRDACCHESGPDFIMGLFFWNLNVTTP